MQQNPINSLNLVFNDPMQEKQVVVVVGGE